MSGIFVKGNGIIIDLFQHEGICWQKEKKHNITHKPFKQLFLYTIFKGTRVEFCCFCGFWLNFCFGVEPGCFSLMLPLFVENSVHEARMMRRGSENDEDREGHRTANTPMEGAGSSQHRLLSWTRFCPGHCQTFNVLFPPSLALPSKNKGRVTIVMLTEGLHLYCDGSLLTFFLPCLDDNLVICMHESNRAFQTWSLSPSPALSWPAAFPRFLPVLFAK